MRPSLFLASLSLLLVACAACAARPTPSPCPEAARSSGHETTVSESDPVLVPAATPPPTSTSTRTTGSDAAPSTNVSAPGAAPETTTASAPNTQASAARNRDSNLAASISPMNADDYAELRRTQTALQRCYDEALAADDTAASRVVATFAVGDHDSLIDVEVTGSTPTLHACVREVLETMSHRHGLASGSRYGTTLNFTRR